MAEHKWQRAACSVRPSSPARSTTLRSPAGLCASPRSAVPRWGRRRFRFACCSTPVTISRQLRRILFAGDARGKRGRQPALCTARKLVPSVTHCSSESGLAKPLGPSKNGYRIQAKPCPLAQSAPPASREWAHTAGGRHVRGESWHSDGDLVKASAPQLEEIRSPIGAVETIDSGVGVSPEGQETDTRISTFQASPT